MADEPAPHPPVTEQRSPFRRMLGLFGGVALWPVILVALGGAPACLGFEDVTLASIEACPAAVELLGAPVSRSWLGLSCGSAETEDDSGHASWDFPVAGPRGRGSVSVVAQESGGTWRLISGSLESGDTTIDLLTCTAGGPMAVTAVDFDATVTSIIGAPGVAIGDACHVSVRPGEGDYPCRVSVACAGNILYGAGSTGWTGCGRGPDGSLRVRDTSPTPSGGDPTLDLSLGAGTAVLTDEAASGTWVVQLAFTPPR
jgi:hypothetical protein